MVHSNLPLVGVALGLVLAFGCAGADPQYSGPDAGAAAGAGGTAGMGGTGGTGATGGTPNVGGSATAGGGTGATGGTGGSAVGGGGASGGGQPSCAGGLLCGAASCCERIPVPAGTFPMGRSDSGADAWPSGSSNEQPEHDATNAAFALDRFEVTVGRFRNFVEQFDGTKPSPGAGAHPQIPNSGWQTSYDSELMPTQATLLNAVQCGGSNANYTAAPGGNENYPMNCVSWYEAFAFCIWDGGRLPTEAEWEAAAAGGTENRLYPWGSQAPDAARANFQGSDFSPHVAVGSHWAGAGRWGHEDQAGSMWEWVLDRYDENWYAPGAGNPCDNCANLSSGTNRVLRGASWNFIASFLRAVYRTNSGPTTHLISYGFRCAWSP